MTAGQFGKIAMVAVACWGLFLVMRWCNRWITRLENRYYERRRRQFESLCDSLVGLDQVGAVARSGPSDVLQASQRPTLHPEQPAQVTGE